VSSRLPRRYLPAICPETGVLEHCYPSLLSSDTRTWAPRSARPTGGALEYRGCCLTCGWVSPTIVATENAAVEDAHDHSHPDWRQLPVVERAPNPWDCSPAQHQKRIGRWLDQVLPLLPDGWDEVGGPIRTRRDPMGRRHVPRRTPWGGYDLCGAIEKERR